VTLYGHIPGGPYFDDLQSGQVFDSAPSMTLTSGAAAVHQAIIGDRLRLALDAELALAVAGAPGPLAHPALVCDVAIGQTTLATQRVKANLFYRGLTFHRFPVVGDTLFTRTEVVGLKQNSAKPGRAPTGLAALRMTTIDDVGRLVLDFYRCAMLPLRDDAADTGHADDLSTIGTQELPTPDPTGEWDADAFRAKVPGAHFDSGIAGTVLHSTADFSSVLKLIERLHGLAPLTTRDEKANDLLGAFDFGQAPRDPALPGSDPAAGTISAPQPVAAVVPLTYAPLLLLATLLLLANLRGLKR